MTSIASIAQVNRIDIIRPDALCTAYGEYDLGVRTLTLVDAGRVDVLAPNPVPAMQRMIVVDGEFGIRRSSVMASPPEENIEPSRATRKLLQRFSVRRCAMPNQNRHGGLPAGRDFSRLSGQSLPDEPPGREPGKQGLCDRIH